MDPQSSATSPMAYEARDGTAVTPHENKKATNTPRQCYLQPDRHGCLFSTSFMQQPGLPTCFPATDQQRRCSPPGTPSGLRFRTTDRLNAVRPFRTASAAKRLSSPRAHDGVSTDGLLPLSHHRIGRRSPFRSRKLDGPATLAKGVASLGLMNVEQIGFRRQPRTHLARARICGWTRTLLRPSRRMGSSRGQAFHSAASRSSANHGRAENIGKVILAT
jgi:hypothetical protein